MNDKNIEFERLMMREMRKVLLQGHTEKLKLYFIDSELTQNDIYYDLEYNINQAFLCACSNDKVELVHYLLTSPELSIHADINYKDNAAIFHALETGSISTTKFLLTSKEIRNNILLDYYLDEIFDMLISQLYIVDENMTPGDANAYCINDEVVVSMNYLIYQHNISPTAHIIELLKEHTKTSYYEPAIKRLEKNAVYNNLSEQLSKGTIKENKLKI